MVGQARPISWFLSEKTSGFCLLIEKTMLTTLFSLIQNIALLVTISVVHQLILQKSAKGTLRYQVLSGLLFGCAGIAVMLTPFRFAPGIFFDSRSIILGVAGLFGGPMVALIAAAICGTFRIGLGGSGAWVGVMVVMQAAVLGVGFHFLRRKDERFAGGLWLFGFGLLVHAVMLTLMLALPEGLGTEALRQIALPVLFLFPLATVLICRIFLFQEKHLAAEDQRSRLILNLQAALDREGSLSQISQTVNRSLNLDQVLNDALDKIMELYAPHSSYIRLYDADARELVFAAQKGLCSTELQLVNRRLKLEHAVATHAIQTGEAVAIEDVLTDPRAAKGHSFAKQIGCRSVVTIILNAKDAIVGSMSMRWREPHVFTAEEIRLFTAIGHQVGTAIENARLFSQVQRQTEMLASLNAVSNTVSQTLDIEKLISDILKKVIALLHCDAGNIRFLDEAGQTLEMVAHRGFSPEHAAKMNVRRKYGEGISWECLEKNRVIFTEFNPEDAYQRKINSFGMRIGSASAIHFPITSKEVKLGILSVYSFAAREFRRDEIELCSGIGRQVGIAIENARLYRQAQNHIKALNDAQTEREKIIEKLRNALTEVKTLSGLLPICSHCKKIRDDQGYWNQIEAYIHKHSGTEFSHGICPDCARKYYPGYNLYDE